MMIYQAKHILTGIIVLLSFSDCSEEKETDPNPASEPACTTALADAETIALFPDNHPINTPIATGKIDSRSDAIIDFIGEGNPGVKADFGSGLYEGSPIGIPFVVVCKDQPNVTITFKGDDYDDNYGDESDAGPYPIPLDAPIEGYGTGDSHVLTLDVDNKKLYELYNANVNGNGWEASSGAVFDLTKTEYRTAGWTSADAAGMAIFPCLVRYEDVASGEINHAIRFTLPKAKVTKGYITPARHAVNGGNHNAAAPSPFGMRLRLRDNFVITGFSTENQVILKAMKKYGIILTDIGSSFYISGAPDDRWNNDDLQELKNVKASDFEVLEIGNIAGG
ncbi:MAG TPA: hypothetical protein VK666_03725 [Chryseolinea sp.]|nr:hypothetical protein [Chryseolinea sp.]